MAKGGTRAGAGRPRKPVEEHLANGTYRPDRHGPLPDAPGAPLQVNRERPKPPPNLSAAQRRVWRELCDDLEQLGILAHSDRYVIEVAARHMGLARDCAKGAAAAVRAHDLELAHKLWKLESENATRGKTAGEQLGLSPSSRHRLGMVLQRAQGAGTAGPTTSTVPAPAAEPDFPASPRLHLAPPA